MAQQEGVAAALRLDDKILNDLKAAQERITAMKNAADGLAKSFESIGRSASDMAQGLKGTGVSFESAFDSSGALKSIKLISEAVVNVSKKASAVKQNFDYTAEIEKTRQKLAELQRQKQGMDNRDIPFAHIDYTGTVQEIERLKAQLSSLLEARHKAFSGKPEKQAQGEFKEYIAGLTQTSDGLKKMNAYYKELEKSSAKAAKEQEKVFNAQQRAQGVEDKAVGILGVSPSNVNQMLDKLRQLKAIKRELETEQKKTGILNPTVLQQVNQQIERTEAGIRHINSRLKETSASANIVRSMLATAFSPFLVQRFIGEMVKVRGEFELSQKSLAVIIGDTAKAQSMFNEITQIAVRSPFSVQDLLKQTKQLAAYRIETDKLIETTKMLGDISAGTGTEMNRLILAYGQVKAAEFLKGCLGIDTPVRTTEGIKKVQDIKVGDCLLNEKMEVVHVKELIRGRELMYRIIQSDGEDYRVNANHILTLYRDGELHDVYVKDYDESYLGARYVAGKIITYPIKVVVDKVDDYYGFVLDGNKRFQLSDGTITHNTELRQFSEAGVNMLGGLAKRFTEIYGRVVSVGEVMQMVSKRMVKFADVEAVLKEATEAGGAFYKMQEKQAETIQGRLSNLQDRVQIMFNNIGKGYDGLIKGVITGLENVISNWQVLSSIIEPVIGMMLLKGTAGLLGFTKVGREIKTVIAGMEGKMIALNGQLSNANKIAIRFRGTVKGIGNFLKANWVSALLLAASILVDLIIKATQFHREVKKIADEARATASEQVLNYERLVDLATDTNAAEEERQKALEKLKSEYGNILNIQKIELSNVQQLNDARAHHIELIQKQAYEEARAQAANAAVENAAKNAEKQADSLNKMVRFYQYLPEEMKAITQFVNQDDMTAVQNTVAQAILRGSITGVEEAGKKAIELTATIAGKSKKEIENLLKNIDTGYVKSIGSIFSRTLDDAKLVDKELSKLPGEIIAKAAQPYQDLIKTLANARSEFDKTHEKAEYEWNPALKDIDYAEYLNSIAQGISKQIDDGALGQINEDIKAALKKQLETALSEASNSGGEVEQAIRNVQNEVASKYGKIGRSIVGGGILKYEKGQSAEDYIKNIDKELKEAIAVSKEWSELQKQIANGNIGPRPARSIEIAQMFNTPEELQRYIQMLDELERKLGAVETAMNKKPKGDNSQKQNLNSFITALQNARKELDKLSSEGDSKYIEKLAFLGKKAGVTLAAGFKGTDAEIMALIDKYKGKLDEADRIDVELNLITDKAEKKMKDYSDLLKDLWDRYDNSKKMEEWGLIPQEGTTSEIMEQIKEMEHELRNSGLGDAAIELADEIAQRIREKFRSEQEEAAKAVYEANKKSLDKVAQAYQTMQEQIAKIRGKGLEKLEEEKGVSGQIAKSMRDVADAQWDAFKSTEAYALAFGDLSNLSDDLLGSLKDNLEQWLKLPEGALQPTEIQAIQKQIRAMNDAMGSNKVKTFFGAIVTGFEEINQRHKLLESIPELSNAVASAMSELQHAEAQERGWSALYASSGSLVALEERQAAQQRVAAAQDKLKEATEEFNTAQNRANKLYSDATNRMSIIEESYSAIANEITSTIGLVKDIAEAFGGSFSDETLAAIEGFEQGFQLVGQAITLATSAMKVYDILQNTVLATGKTLLATIEPFMGPLLVAIAALGAALAIFKARDASLAKQVEQHKENVEKLEKAYDRLDKAIDKALNLESARQTYAEMNANLARQRDEINEAIAAQGQRKQTDKVKEETEELQEQLVSVADQMQETKDKWLEMLGAPTDYQGVSRDWASGWLSAFKETGNGLDALKDSFAELYDDLVAGQIWSRIMGPRIEELQGLIESSLADGRLEDMEAAAIRQYRSVFGQLNEQAKGLATQLGITPGSASGETLQRGVESVTEKTAEALESILNATRYDVADTNVRVANIENILGGTGENTILSQLRSQTRYLADIARIASAVYVSGAHYKGGNGGFKVFAEIK